MSDTNFSIRDKLERETSALKSIIYGQIKERNLDAAGQILNSYETVMPRDSEIKSIRRMLSLAASENGAGIPEKAETLGKVETIFIMRNLYPTRNGIMISVLNKTKLMEEVWGYFPLILICERNLNLPSIRRALLEEGGESKLSISQDTRIVSLYEYFQKSYSEGLQRKAVYTRADSEERYEERAPGVYEVYDEGVLVRKEHFTGHNGSLRLTERYAEGEKTFGVFYDDWGYVNSILKYNPDDDSRYESESFYTVENRLRIKVFYKYEDGENQIERVILYDDNGGVEGEFESNAGLAGIYFKQALKESKFYMFVVEDSLYAEAVTNLEMRNTAKTMVVHSILFDDPYEPDTSPPQWYYRYLCANHEKFDGIIFPTHDERRDFYRRFGSIRGTFVIPHAYPHEIIRVDFDKRDHRKAVSISRLDQYKAVDLAIEVFALAVKRLPDIRLEIYGAGKREEREKCQRLIKELNMEDNIFFKGFTPDPMTILRTAAAFMMTSTAEGFGLTLMESICNGCPAFAFDIKHGPSEIISDGITGYLLPRYDIELYADRLVNFFQDIELQRTMSENAYIEAPRFGPEAFLENWYRMTETLCRVRI